MRGHEATLVACTVLALSACTAPDGSSDVAVDSEEEVVAIADRHRRDMAATPANGMSGLQGRRATVEIRSYNIKPGTRAEFDRLVVEEAIPLLRRWNVDVVGYGPSRHDETSYFLIRTYKSLEERERSEEAFYGSAEWREGPREAILALIDSYVTIVLELDTDAIDALRTDLARSTRHGGRL